MKQCLGSNGGYCCFPSDPRSIYFFSRDFKLLFHAALLHQLELLVSLVRRPTMPI
jgi:hypothetical protein